MVFESDKIMFEIYREAGHDRTFRVVYFTELEEHNKDSEITRAMEGEHFYDSFFKESTLVPAKEKLCQVLGRLNEGEALTTRDVEEEIKAYLA